MTDQTRDGQQQSLRTPDDRSKYLLENYARPEMSDAHRSSNDLLTKLRWIGSIAAFKEPDIARACADAAGEIERLTRERDDAQAEWAALSQDDGKVERALERVESERDRLRAVLRDALAECLEENGQDLTGEHWSSRAEALLPDVSGEPPAHETNRDAADAARYRWLKAEDRKRMPLATISWRQRSTGLPCKLADNDPLDALIDAAITSPDASVEQVYRTAVKASGSCPHDRPPGTPCPRCDL